MQRSKRQMHGTLFHKNERAPDTENDSANQQNSSNWMIRPGLSYTPHVPVARSLSMHQVVKGKHW